MTKNKAKSEEEKSTTTKDLESTMTELKMLDNTKQGLHGECDFLLKNFDLRQGARSDEIAALGEAMAYLKGMN